MATLRATALTLAALLLTGCGREPTASRVRADAVVITATTDTLWALGESAQFAAEARLADGTVVSGVRIEWRSLDSTVVRATPGGLVTARGVGIAFVIAALPSGPADTALIAVRQRPAGIRVTPDARTMLGEDTTVYEAFIVDAGGFTIPDDTLVAAIEWATVDPEVASILRTEQREHSSSAIARRQGPGTTRVDAKLGSFSGSASLEVMEDPVLEYRYVGIGGIGNSSITVAPSGRWYYYRDSPYTLVAGGSGGAWTQMSLPGVCTGAPRNCTVTADTTGTLYVPVGAEGLMAVEESTGATRWHARIGMTSGGAAVSGERAFMGTWTGLVALDAKTGAQLWRHDTPGFGASLSPILDESRGVVYYGATDHTTSWIFAANAATGKRLWSYTTHGSLRAPAALAADGTLYVPTTLGTGGEGAGVLAITPRGKLRWRYATQVGVHGSPVIDAAGTVYVATRDMTIHALSPEGDVRWSYRATPISSGGTDSFSSSPVLDASGTLYVGSRYSGAYVLRDGRLIGMIPELRLSDAHPVIAPNGELLVGAQGWLVRVRTAGFPAAAQWPMAHRDPRRSSRG